MQPGPWAEDFDRERAIPIRYVDFHDVPRLFAVDCDPPVLFVSDFSDLVDDYSPTYEVYRVAHLPHAEELAAARREGLRIGEVPVDEVGFDETKRTYIDGSVLGRFTRYLADPTPSPWWEESGRFQPHYEVTLDVLSTVAGGRRSPIFDGYRPGVRFDDADPVHHDGSFHLLPGADSFVSGVRRALPPGGHGRARLVPLAPDLIETRVEPGTRFEVLEGTRCVATGRVEHVKPGDPR